MLPLYPLFLLPLLLDSSHAERSGPLRLTWETRGHVPRVNVYLLASNGECVYALNNLKNTGEATVTVPEGLSSSRILKFKIESCEDWEVSSSSGLFRHIPSTPARIRKVTLHGSRK